MAENIFGITDTGKVRTNNEDTYIATIMANGRFMTACVIDGVGGYTGGEVASQLARQAIEDHLKIETGDKINLVKDALVSANDVVYRERQLSKQNSQMACVATLALIDVENNKFYYGHVGDTRLYLYRDHTLVKISHDHSFVGFLEDSGRLTESEAMNHAKRNEINKALGFTNSVHTDDYIETGESPFLPGDVLLLCSDGLSDMVDRKGMIEILGDASSFEEKGKTLINMANNAGGKDNITLVLVRNERSSVTHTATKPATKTITLPAGEKKPPVSTEYKAPETFVPDIKKKGSGAVPILSVLLVLLLAAFVWLFFQYQKKKGEPVATTLAVATVVKRSDKELRLIDSINASKNTEAFVYNTAGGESISISDTISINRDTFYIKGNGATFVPNDNFKGPLFVISPQAKYIMIDSLTLENFDLGFLVHNNSLHFKDVVFKNCKVPVQYNLSYPNNTPVNGGLIDTPVDTVNAVNPQPNR